MNVLCVLEKGSWAESHLAGSIRALGHEVTVFHHGSGVGEFYGRSRRQVRAEKNQALLRQARALRAGTGLDLIFCYVYDDFLEEETARGLARLDVPLVNYNVDMATQWYRQSRTARYFTMMLCAQRVNMSRLARYNRRVLHFPMAAKPISSPAEARQAAPPDAPVTFVGTPRTYRTRLLGQLHSSGIPLAIYGKYWLERREPSRPATLEKILHDILLYGVPKWQAEGFDGMLRALQRHRSLSRPPIASPLPARLFKGFVPEEELNSLFAQSEINLGFSRIAGDDPATPGVTQVKLRDFEVPLAGGFYLVEWVKEYDEFFNAGVEVETWRTREELIDKLRYYLSHDAERRRIALAGSKRAVAEHTWDKRFAMLFAELGLKATPHVHASSQQTLSDPS